MKKVWRYGMCLAAAVMLLSLTVLAAGEAVSETLEGGYYGLENVSGVTVKVLKADGTQADDSKSVDVDNSGSYVTMYPGTERLKVTMSGQPAGEYLVLLAEGSDLPTEADEILYINQTTVGSDGAVEFDVYPTVPAARTDMTLYITSNASGFKMKSLRLGYAPDGAYNVQPYTLGDVNSDGKIDANDALKALRIGGKLENATDTQEKAADVNRDGKLDANDALKILRYAGKLIGSWDEN